MTLLPPFSLPTPIPFYIEKLKEEIDEEISRTNDKSNTRKSHVSCSFETPNGSLVSLLALPHGSSIYTSASHWNPKTTNNNYYEQKETSNQKYLQWPAFPPLSEAVYISLCFFSLRFYSSLLHISSYIRSHLYSLSWKEEMSDQTSRHATHEYSVFPQPIVLHTAYSTHLPYPVTFKFFISKVMFCVSFRKRFLVR
jgi:hypothetical protein